MEAGACLTVIFSDMRATSFISLKTTSVAVLYEFVSLIVPDIIMESSFFVAVIHSDVELTDHVQLDLTEIVSVNSEPANSISDLDSSIKGVAPACVIDIGASNFQSETSALRYKMPILESSPDVFSFALTDIKADEPPLSGEAEIQSISLSITQGVSVHVTEIFLVSDVDTNVSDVGDTEMYLGFNVGYNSIFTSYISEQPVRVSKNNM